MNIPAFDLNVIWDNGSHIASFVAVFVSLIYVRNVIKKAADEKRAEQNAYDDMVYEDEHRRWKAKRREESREEKQRSRETQRLYAEMERWQAMKDRERIRKQDAFNAGEAGYQEWLSKRKVKV